MTVACILVLGSSISWKFWPNRFILVCWVKLVKWKKSILCSKVFSFLFQFLDSWMTLIMWFTSSSASYGHKCLQQIHVLCVLWLLSSSRCLCKANTENIKKTYHKQEFICAAERVILFYSTHWRRLRHSKPKCSWSAKVMMKTFVVHSCLAPVYTAIRALKDICFSVHWNSSACWLSMIL